MHSICQSLQVSIDSYENADDNINGNILKINEIIAKYLIEVSFFQIIKAFQLFSTFIYLKKCIGVTLVNNNYVGFRCTSL